MPVYVMCSDQLDLDAIALGVIGVPPTGRSIGKSDLNEWPGRRDVCKSQVLDVHILRAVEGTRVLD